MQDVTWSFWAELDTIRKLLQTNPIEAQRSLDRLYSRESRRRSRQTPHRLMVASEFAGTYGLEAPDRLVAPVHNVERLVAPVYDLPGVSVVNGCMNRTDNLLKALETWLAAPEVSEVVIVDWSSEVPVAETLDVMGIDDPRIVVARVEDETRYLHSEVHNVGFRLARHERVLKADAETMIAPDFFQRNKLEQGTFLAGNWRTRPWSKGEVNGSCLAFRRDILNIKGSSEYLQGYGWEDDDFYFRLWASGLIRRNVEAGSLWSIEHDDSLRFDTEKPVPATAREELRDDRMAKIHFNRLLTAILPEWPAGSDWAEFSVSYEDQRRPVIKRTGMPRTVMGPELREALEVMSAYIVLSSTSDEIRQVAPHAVRQLIDENRLSGITRKKVSEARKAGFNVPMIAPVRKPRLFIDAMNGLGNRMRAIGSAHSIARATERELVVIWQPDDHCDCKLSDLFDYDGAVVEERFLKAAAAGGFDTYNYMDIEPGAQKHEDINPKTGNDVYVRSAYVLNSQFMDWDVMRAFLQKLRPVDSVQELVKSVRHPNDLSAHVRMVGGSEHTDLAYESRDVFTAAEFEEGERWRTRSHYANFFHRIDELLKEKAFNTIFVAADSDEAYRAFSEKYGEQVVWLERQLYDRSADQLKYALADMILLGHCKRMLCSNWSSFSEVARYLSPKRESYETSGVDF